MEADWEFELGGDAPIIDALWPGFVDLRWTSQSAADRAARLRTLPETAQLPCLAETLEKLNAEHSPVWTAKCDFWPALQADEFDSDELDAPAGSFAHAAGCYIDLLPKSDEQWPFPEAIAASCRNLCTRLHSFRLRCCRVDLMIRRAQIAPGQLDLGITTYFTACGPLLAEAMRTLEAALAAFTDALFAQSTLQ